MPIIYADGAVLNGTDLNTNVAQVLGSLANVRFASGQNSFSIGGSTVAQNVACTWAASFNTIIACVVSVQSYSNVDWVCTMQGAPSVSGVTVRIATTTGTAAAIGSGNIEWTVIGT